MRRRTFIASFIVSLLFVIPLITNAQNSIYHKYATEQEVKYVCITHTMLEAMSRNKTISIGNMQLSEMVNDIECILIIGTETAQGKQIIESDLRGLLEDATYQTLLVKNINGKHSTSLFRKGYEYNEFVLFSIGQSCTIIVITGHFSPEQFQSFFL